MARSAATTTIKPGATERVVAALQAMLDLPANWDGNGARQPSTQAAFQALVFWLRVDAHVGPQVGEAVEPWLISPLPNGNVFLEWHGHDGATLDLEIRADRTTGYLLGVFEGGARRFEEIEGASLDQALAVVGRLFGVHSLVA